MIEGLFIKGTWTCLVDAIRAGIHGHFKRHFQKSELVRARIPGHLVRKKVVACNNSFLVAPFTTDEIKEVIWACESNKSPVPDGFSFRFIKENWENMKREILMMMNELHSKERFVKGMNPSFIVLVPKKEGRQSIDDFRPISLIGCLYKIISKTLARRLSKVLESLISETQSAFIDGRQILDGIVVLNEIVGEAKKKKLSLVIFKVDFEKAL